jgi:Cys-rich repeat protein
MRTTCNTNSDCKSSAAPICDTNTHLCVACIADSDCSAGNFCDGTTHACTAKMPNGGSCTANNMCSSGVCTAGACAPASCPSGQSVCNSACVDLSTDSNNCGFCGHICPGTPPGVCTSGICGGAQPTCNVDTDCASSNLFCDGTTHACTAKMPNGGSCTANNMCSSGVCSTSSHTCVQCNADSDCSAGNVCKANQCVPGCASGLTSCGGVCVDTKSSNNNCGVCGNACGVGLACRSGTCGPPTCTSNADCTSLPGTICDTQLPSGLCVPQNSGLQGFPCNNNADCQSGTCTNNACTAPSCPSGQTDCGGICVNLQNNPADCGACGATCGVGQTCNAGQCQTVTNTCTSDLNCMPGTVCDTTVGFCVPKGPAGTSCTANDQCQSGACTLGQCTTPTTCKTDADCPSTHFCVLAANNFPYCQLKGTTGTLCGGNNQCQSGICKSNGACG